MALQIIQLLKKLPRTNRSDSDYATCMAFATHVLHGYWTWSYDMPFATDDRVDDGYQLSGDRRGINHKYR
jgi:CO dehydrogenase/acetyl-CoA synthase gamma subunit (corrinoid Fe-S protein)